MPESNNGESGYQFEFSPTPGYPEALSRMDNLKKRVQDAIKAQGSRRRQRRDKIGELWEKIIALIQNDEIVDPRNVAGLNKVLDELEQEFNEIEGKK